MLNDDDEARSNRVMQAMLQMEKLDINVLKQAYAARDNEGRVRLRKSSVRRS